MCSKAAVTNPHERPGIRRFEFPPNPRFYIAGPSRAPGREQEPWRIDFQVFANNFKWPPIAVYAHTPPHSTDAQIALEFRAAIDTRLTPPLHDLGGIDQGLKDPLRWRGNSYLSDNLVFFGLGGRTFGVDMVTSDLAFGFPAFLFRRSFFRVL